MERVVGFLFFHFFYYSLFFAGGRDLVLLSPLLVEVLGLARPSFLVHQQLVQIMVLQDPF